MSAKPLVSAARRRGFHAIFVPLLQRRQHRLLTLLVAVSLLLGVTAGLAALFRQAPRPNFVYLEILGNPAKWTLRETVAQRDALALREGGYFPRWRELPAEMPTRRMVLEKLASLGQIDATESLVLYLVARAEVDASGKLALLIDGSGSDQSLLMRDVLSTLRDCPSERKLLVVDLAPAQTEALWPTTQADVVFQLLAELKQVDDPQRQVFCACQADETPLNSELWGRSGLAYFFELAVAGAADGWLDGRSDGRVSVSEMARFVRTRVAEWAQTTQGRPQTPFLVGEGPDFELGTVSFRQKRHKAQATPALTEREYPKWLAQAWDERQTMWKQHDHQLAPRVFREWERALLRAEEQWRGGRDDGHTRLSLFQELEPLRGRLQQARAAIPRVRSFSLALSRERRPIPDEDAATKALEEFLTDLEGKTQSLPEDKAEVMRRSLIKGFFDKAKKISSDAIASAVIDQLEGSRALSPGHIELLDELLRQRQPRPLYVETLFLRRLAELGQGHAWDADQLAVALRAVHAAARAIPADRTFAWTQSNLGIAAQHGHNGEYLFFRPGYAPDELAEAYFREAEREYERVTTARDSIRRAYEVLDVAWLRLPTLMDLNTASNLNSKVWFEAIDAAVVLSDTLALANGDPVHGTGDLSHDVGMIRAHALLLERLLEELRLPVGTEAIGRLAQRAREPDAPAELAPLINVTLRWPGLSAASRQELLAAKRVLDERLHAISHSARGASAEPPNLRVTSEAAFSSPKARGEFIARVHCVLALLRLGGLADQIPAKLQSELDEISRNRSTSEFESVWQPQLKEIVKARIRNGDAWSRARLGAILPAYQMIPQIDGPAENSYVAVHRAVLRGRFHWLAEYFAYRAHDDLAMLHAELARRYVPLGGVSQESYLRFDAPRQLSRPADTGGHITADIRWRFVGAKDAQQKSDTLKVLQPESDFIIRTNVVNRDSESELVLKLSQTPGNASRSAAGKGVLLQVESHGRTWHQTLPFQSNAGDSGLLILLSTGKEAPRTQANKLRFRPTSEPQALHLFVANVTEQASNIVIEIPEVTSAPVTIPAQETRQVALKPPAPKEGAAPPEIGNELTILLRDADTAELLLKKRFPIEVLTPAQYVRVTESQFRPRGNGDNRLAMTLQAENMPPGPPCVVNLELSPETIPGFLGVTGGMLRGVLPADGSPLALAASGLQLLDGFPEDSEFSLSIDGVSRAFTFAGALPRRGDLTSPRQVSRPAIALEVPQYALAGPGFQATTHVTQGPSDSSLHLRIGRTSESGFVTELQRTLPGTRRSVVQTAVGKTGELVFQIGLEDWTFEVDASGIVGPRIVKVDLVDSRGHSLASDSHTVIFDDTPPERVFFVDPPVEALVKKPIPLRIGGADAVSGVKQVFVFNGRPDGDKLPEGAKEVPAENSPEGQEWTAMLPPAKTVGTIEVTARVVNAVGLSSFLTRQIKIVDQLSAPGGKIEGTVLEGPRPQAKMPVTLLDKGNTVLRTALTDANGSFVFDGLAPGDYAVAARKGASGRQARQPVTVTAGKTVKKSLELSL